MTIYLKQIAQSIRLTPWNRLVPWLGVLLVFGLFAGCLDDSEQAPTKVIKPPQKERSIEHPTEKPSRPQTEGDPDTPLNLAAVPPRVLPKKPYTEALRGYKTPAEYLFIPSERFPDAVVAVTLPLDYAKQPNKRYPLVIAFGGAGECARIPRDGALAWMHYYKADEAAAALSRNVLHEGDFRRLATSSEIQAFNRKLADKKYGGVILVCPSSPPLVSAVEMEEAGYEAFIIQDLVPELMRRYRVALGGIGVDGVSMGGARAMYYGLKYPDLFCSMGSSQGAFRPFLPIYKELADKNRETLKNRPVQLVTSDKDPLAPSVQAMRVLLEERGIRVSYLKLTGPHDYIFNQGPGALSLLLFHDRAFPRPAAGPVR
jgi:iron(III)-salmochelin esterase